MLRKIASLIGGKKKERQWVVRAPRVSLYPPRDVRFKPDSPETSGVPESVYIANISASGIGFFKTPEQTWAEVGTQFSGMIHIGDRKSLVTLEIVRISPRTVGCRVIGDVSHFAHNLNRHFHIELSALKLIEVHSDVLKEESDGGKPHLFRGAESCELFYVEKDDHILRFQISFFGNYIEGGQEQKTRFGHLHSDDAEKKPKQQGSTLVQLDSEVPVDIQDLAVRFISYVPNLKKQTSERISAAIRNAE